jgi:hypothetical protein
MKSLRKQSVKRWTFAACLMLAGAVIWNDRLEFSPESALQASGAPSMTLLDSTATSDLTSACSLAEREQGWILFVVTALLTSDNIPKGFFETALDEQGLYIDYDPRESAMLRIGVTSDGTTRFVPFRTVRRTEEAFIAIAVRQTELRIITNAVDRTKHWSDFQVNQLRCDAVKPGISDEIECGDCNVSVRYLAGSGGAELNTIMRALSNRRAYETKRWFGNGLVFLGIASVMFRRKSSKELPSQSK